MYEHQFTYMYEHQFTYMSVTLYYTFRLHLYRFVTAYCWDLVLSSYVYTTMMDTSSIRTSCTSRTNDDDSVQTVSALGGVTYLMDYNGQFRNSFSDGWDRVLSKHPIPFYYGLGMHLTSFGPVFWIFFFSVGPECEQ